MGFAGTFDLKNVPIVNHNGDQLIYFPFARKIIRINGDNFNPYRNKIIEVNLLEESSKKTQNRYVPSAILSQITFILTNRCNLNCTYCYLRDDVSNKSKDMNWKTIHLTLEKYLHKINGVPLISFFGGEATLRFDLIKKTVKNVRKLQPETIFHLSSNGTFNNEVSEFLLNEMFIISISCDGKAEQHNKNRKFVNGEGSWEKIIENIRILQTLPVIIRMTLTKNNIDHIPPAIQFFTDTYGIKFFHIEIVSETGNTNEYLPNPHKISKCFDEILSILEKSKGYIFHSSWQNIVDPQSIFCSAFKKENVIINPEGNITGCYRIHNPSGIFNFGSITNDNFTATCDLEPFLYKDCKECDYRYICGGGCIWRNSLNEFELGGNKSEICDIKKMLISKAIITLYQASKKRNHNPILADNGFNNYLKRRVFA
ncbi:radical SAM protein [Patescibacteria group bacterium]|nr:radical SAM protein [Patescibacteria group bacterium]